jgi:hypothetical protein
MRKTVIWGIILLRKRLKNGQNDEKIEFLAKKKLQMRKWDKHRLVIQQFV